MKLRKVTHTLYAEQYDMGGMPIRQPLPSHQVEQVDPFLLLHHAVVKVPKHIVPDKAGVGPHPHRGFSPVTFIFKGGVHHRDSRGNNSVVYAGGAQWMNAGMGIVHSERPPHDIHDIGGVQEIIQLWINTPAAHKLDQPAYFPLEANDIPKRGSADGKVVIGLIAGNLFDLKGPVSPHSPVNAATIEAKTDGILSIPIPPTHNALLYLLHGKISVSGHGIIDALHAVVFDNHGDGIEFTALEDSQILFLTGEPLNEKVVAQGPFVMNSETQILEAMSDYQMGKMGVLIED